MPVDALLARDDIGIVVNLTSPRPFRRVARGARGRASTSSLKSRWRSMSRRAAKVWSGRRRRGGCWSAARPTHFSAGAGAWPASSSRTARSGASVGHSLPNVSRDGALASRPGVLLQARRGPVLAWRRLHQALVNLSARKRVLSLSTGFPERSSPPNATQGRKDRGGDADHGRPSWNLLGRAGDVRHELGRLAARPPGDRALRHGRHVARARPQLLRRVVETTERGGEWRAQSATTAARRAQLALAQLGSRTAPPANYRALGLADLASAFLHGTPHRSTGRLALHVLEVMHAILEGAATGQPTAITTTLDRPAVLPDDEAAELWRGLPQTTSAA